MRYFNLSFIIIFILAILILAGLPAQAATAAQDAYCRSVYGNDTKYNDLSNSCVITSFQQVQGIKISADNPLNLQVGQLVKNREFAEVFYVSEGIILQWIMNEAAAERRFGPTWNKIIHEVDSLDSYGFGSTIQ